MTDKIEISEAEFEVMEVLWKCSPSTAKKILQKLEKDWRLTTLNTLLSRLIKKGAVSHSKSGREYVYTPLLERESYVTQQSQDFLHKVFGGQLSPFVAHFSKHKSMEKEDIEALKKLIQQWDDENE